MDKSDIIIGMIKDLKDDLAPRVRTIEAWQENANGKISIISAISVFIGGIVTYIANKH